MVRSVLDLGHTLVREVMVPRTDMVTIDADTPAASALRLFVRSGFSRIPVVGDDVDDIRGILFFKDLVSRWEATGGHLDLRAEQMMRPAEYAVEMKPADDMLRQMQAERFHMAIVIDEYGGAPAWSPSRTSSRRSSANSPTNTTAIPSNPRKQSRAPGACPHATRSLNWANSSAATSKTRTSTPSAASSLKRLGGFPCPVRPAPSPAS